jgi:hypothetical protein
MPRYSDVETFGKKTAERVEIKLAEVGVVEDGKVEGVFWY